MKRLSLLILSLSLISCGNSDPSVEDLIKEGNLSEIRAKKAELNTRQSEITAQIVKLDAAIEELDKHIDLDLVSTYRVEDTLFRHFVELPGDVATDENIIIYPEYSGMLREVLVEEGDHVRKGQVLARIDDGGLISQVAQLEAREALARTTFERQKRLWDQQIGSEIQFLESKTNYEAISQSVAQLRAQFERTVVRAPFSGVIDQGFADQGEIVSPGQSRLFRLIDLSDMYITTAVPETYLGQIVKGSEVLVEIGATGKKFKSKITQVGNFINPNNRTFEVRVSVPDSIEMIKPNLIATVKLNDYRAKDAVIIPENVIQKNASGESIVYVYVPENDSTGTAIKRTLKTGTGYQGNVEVISGLQNGELLITEGAKNIHDGEKVQVIRQ